MRGPRSRGLCLDARWRCSRLYLWLAHAILARTGFVAAGICLMQANSEMVIKMLFGKGGGAVEEKTRRDLTRLILALFDQQHLFLHHGTISLHQSISSNISDALRSPIPSISLTGICAGYHPDAVLSATCFAVDANDRSSLSVNHCESPRPDAMNPSLWLLFINGIRQNRNAKREYTFSSDLPIKDRCSSSRT